MKTADFDFTLPERLIPLLPPDLRGERRDHARMLVLRRAEARVEHSRFDRLGEYLRAGDVLVVNDTLVVNDQLPGLGNRRAVTLVLFGQHPEGWLAAVRPASRAKPGLVVEIDGFELDAELVRPAIGNLWLVRFKHHENFDLDDLLLEAGGPAIGNLVLGPLKHPKIFPPDRFLKEPGGPNPAALKADEGASGGVRQR